MSIPSADWQAQQQAPPVPAVDTESPQIGQNPLDQPTENFNDIERMRQESFGHRMMTGVLDALTGGGTQYTPVVTPNGVQQQPAAKTPGSQWKQIIAGAIAGAGGGLANAGTGPAAPARALGGGIQAGQKMIEDQHKQQMTEANTAFQQQQQAAMQNAQIAHMNTQKVMMDWQMSREQMEATENEIKNANQMQTIIAAGGTGTRYVDHFPDVSAAMKAAKAVPELHDQHAGGPDGQLVYVSHFTDGKHDGVDAYWVSKTWKDQKYQGTIKVPRTQWQDGKPVTSWETIEPGQVSNEVAYNMLTSIDNEEKSNALTQADIEFKNATKGLERRKVDIEERRENREAELEPLQKERLQAETEALRNKDPWSQPALPAGQFDPAFPPVQNFPRGTPGIDVKAINKGLDANDQKTETLSNNVISNANQAKNIIDHANFPQLSGSATGRLTQLKTWLGTDDARISSLKSYVHQLALANIGIHGMRNFHSVEEVEDNILNDWKNGPNAAKGAIDAAVDSANNFKTQIQNKRLYGTPEGPDRNRQITAPAAATQQPAAAAAVSPGQGKTFNLANWKLANPSGNPDEALAEAQRQGYVVIGR